MKKSLVFVFGLIFLSGLVVPFSLASRDAYHVYLTSQKNLRSSRYFTDRKGDLSRLSQVKLSSKNKGTKQVRNLRFPINGKRYLYSRVPTTSSVRTIRSSTQSIGSQWKNTLERSTFVKPVVLENNFKFETYENEAFSMQLPTGWANLEKKAHFFTSLEGDFTISIKKFEDEPCKSTEGFMTCAIALSKNENRNAVEGEGKLLTTSRIIRQSHNSDTILNKFEIKTATYTENFNANFQGIEKHVSRYFVQDLDGGVYLISTITTPQKAGKYLGVSKQIFDSFRLYGNEE